MKIIGIVALPYPNKFVVKVARGDGRHLPNEHVYVCDYSNVKLVKSLSRHFCKLNELLQEKLIDYRIKELTWKKE